MGNNIRCDESKHTTQLDVVEFFWAAIVIGITDSDANQEKNKLMPNNPHNLKINKSCIRNTNIPRYMLK